MYKYTRLLAPIPLALAIVGCGSSTDDNPIIPGLGTPGTGTPGTGTPGSGGAGPVINVGTGASAGTNGGGITTQDGGTRTLTPAQVVQIQDAACTGWSTEGEQLPATLQLVIDVSGSMTDPAPGGGGSKWQVTQGALREAITDLSASTGVGMLYYPNGNTPASNTAQDVDRCVNTDALIETALLGGPTGTHRQTVLASLNQPRPANYTPTHDAYQYALENGLKPFQSGAPKFMLLITDGAPTMSLGCIRPNQGVVDMPTDPIIADVAAARAAGIKSFIIGSPGSEESSESNTDMRPWLSRAATAGGTPAAGCNDSGPNFCHMDMTQAPDFAAALTAALSSIVNQISPCVYSIPPPPMGQTINADAINLMIHTETGDTLVLPDGQGSCTEGWNFDANGNVALCPVTCDRVKADANATVELLFGCRAGDIPGVF